MAAGRLLDQSIALDPDNASAHAWAAQWHIFAVGQGWASTPTADIERARGLAQRAILLDPEDARGLTLAGHVCGFIDRRPDEALVLHERAIAANPNLPLSWCLSGSVIPILAPGRRRFAAFVKRLRCRRRIRSRISTRWHCAGTLVLQGVSTEAMKIGQRAISLNPGFSSSYKTHLAVLGHLGHAQAAAETKAALLALEPGFTVEEALRRSPITEPAARARVCRGAAAWRLGITAIRALGGSTRPRSCRCPAGANAGPPCGQPRAPQPTVARGTGADRLWG